MCEKSHGDMQRKCMGGGEGVMDLYFGREEAAKETEGGVPGRGGE